MTLVEARERYLEADCSYFLMCKNNYLDYIDYRQLEVPKEQENQWRREKMDFLRRKLVRTGEASVFLRLYRVASGFQDFDTLTMLTKEMQLIRTPVAPTDRLAIAEAILGRQAAKARRGMVFWACDNGQRALAILLLEWAMDWLDIPDKEDAGLDRKIRKARRVCGNIAEELGFAGGKE